MVGKCHLLQTVAVFGNTMFTKSINGVTLRILEMVARVTIILTRERRLLPAVVSPPRKRICFTLKRLRYFQNGIRLILGFRFNSFQIRYDPFQRLSKQRVSHLSYCHFVRMFFDSSCSCYSAHGSESFIIM